MSGHAAAPVPGGVQSAQNYVWNPSQLRWDAMTQPGGTGSGTGYETVWIKNISGSTINPSTLENQQGILGLAPAGGYDEIIPSYTGDDMTSVVFKKATVTVATLTIGYTNGKVTSVVRS